jgi:hypothetical protein
MEGRREEGKEGERKEGRKLKSQMPTGKGCKFGSMLPSSQHSNPQRIISYMSQ